MTKLEKFQKIKNLKNLRNPKNLENFHKKSCKGLKGRNLKHFKILSTKSCRQMAQARTPCAGEIMKGSKKVQGNEEEHVFTFYPGNHKAKGEIPTICL